MPQTTARHKHPRRPKRQPKFDAGYYRRYYLNPATRAQTPAAAKRQAAFIAAHLRYLEMPVRRILDLGCGLGRVLQALAQAFPRARCEGVEYSSYLCRKYGWTQGSAVDFKARSPFDLVICNDVLPSLNDADCNQAINNIASLCRGIAFLGILTAEDWALCDRGRTDPNVHLRPARWYQRRLHKHFINLGGGFWLQRDAEVCIWHLDSLGR